MTADVIDLAEHRHVLCSNCGHGRSWHATESNGCTYELNDDAGWIRCGCAEFQA